MSGAASPAPASPAPEAPPPFEAPWHAELFALTVALNEAGAFTWPAWTEALGARLAQRRAGAPPGALLDGGDDYFLAWLDALETLLAETGATTGPELATLRAAWRRAYLTTPHGAPATLGSGF